jgi:hypothetical protein
VIDASRRAGRPSYGELEAVVVEQAALIETLRARIDEQDRVIEELRVRLRRELAQLVQAAVVGWVFQAAGQEP